MKTILLSGFNYPYAALGALTAPLMEDYAKQHGYEFNLCQDWPESIPPMWRKLILVRETLQACDRVLWMDADIVITNPEISIEDCKSGIHLSQDWGRDAIDESYFSCGCYVICRDSIEVLHYAYQHANDYKDLPFGDQDALRDIFENHKFQDLFRIHPRRRFNAVPQEIHPDVVDPWQPGDFAAHLTMVSLQERIELFHKLKSSR